MRGNSRIRLLNCIARAPLDCPVAVVFGHACAMNWAGPAYDDVGIALTDALWQAGYPADLIPSSEIANNALRINKDGAIQYGPQQYAAVVLYHPEFENETTAAFFRQAASGPTALYRVGDWTMDFDGQAFRGISRLPSRMQSFHDARFCATAVVEHLRQAGIEQQTPASGMLTRFSRRSCSPATAGQCRLIDGTKIIVAGSHNVSGDPIRQTIRVGSYRVAVDAIGVVGIRLNDRGKLVALAAGGLRNLSTKHQRITLPERIDLALWKDRHGKMHGLLQNYHGPVPRALKTITDDWQRLDVPPPLPSEHDASP